jgi:Sortase domain
MEPEYRPSQLELVLAIVLPAVVVFAIVALASHRPDPGVRLGGGGGSPAALARLAERPLQPLEARGGRAGVGTERLEPLAGGIRPATPVRISIPAAGVNAAVQPVGERDGRMEVPPIGRAGWFDAGPRPGEPGRAVIVGHLDTRHGPGLFAKVPSLSPGTDISVLDRRGDRYRYSVVGSAQVSKERFPVSNVYGASKAPVLVVVTCGGPYRHGHYQDNVLLYARAA